MKIGKSDAPPKGSKGVALLDVQAVSKMLGCSPRHVYRLSEARQMPQPIRLAELIRWRLTDIQCWIETGCKPLPTEMTGGSNGK